MTALSEPPALVVTIELEQTPHLHIVCNYEADRERLESWLKRSGIWNDIAALIEKRIAA